MNAELFERHYTEVIKARDEGKNVIALTPDGFFAYKTAKEAHAAHSRKAHLIFNVRRITSGTGRDW
jgi:hypothetical protein